MTAAESAQQLVFGGDFGPWYRYVPEAWQQAANPELAVSVGHREAALNGELEDAIAYWNPLLHLTIGGLGWANVPLGLERWIRMGRPVDDPVLRTIRARWGPDLEIFVEWAFRWGGETWRGHEAGDPALQSTVSDPRYLRWFSGGTDPLHLGAHAQWLANFPIQPREGWRDVVRLIPKGSRGDHAVTTLVSDSYVNLFDALAHDLIDAQVDGRSRRVALWCPSIGWLGTYRKSRESGRWFRGRHRWHVIGQ